MKTKRHKWLNSDEGKSVCEKCGIVRLRMTNLKKSENVVYYHPTSPASTEYKAPKCKTI
jgi:hypothetical protein